MTRAVPIIAFYPPEELSIVEKRLAGLREDEPAFGRKKGTRFEDVAAYAMRPLAPENPKQRALARLFGNLPVEGGPHLLGRPIECSWSGTTPTIRQGDKSFSLIGDGEAAIIRHSDGRRERWARGVRLGT